MIRYMAIVSCLFFIISCKDEPIQTIEPRTWSNGVFISNEGAFNHSNSSLGWYDYENEKYQSKLYKNTNGQDLGDVFQSISFSKSQMFLTVNNSNKVELLEIDSLNSQSVFAKVQSPRFSLYLSKDKVYTTSIKDRSIAVWNPQSGELNKKIAFNGWSENIVQYKNYLIVSNPSFYSGKPTNHVYIINVESDKIIDSIKVLTSPGQMLIDQNKQLWIYCNGHYNSNIKGGLSVVDLNTFEMVRSNSFDDLNPGYATALAFNSKGDSILYLKKDVYKMSINQQQLPKQTFINSKGRTFYGLGVDKNNRIWVSDAVDYIQKGVVSIYNPNGQLYKEFRAGVIPSRFYFR